MQKGRKHIASGRFYSGIAVLKTLIFRSGQEDEELRGGASPGLRPPSPRERG